MGKNSLNSHMRGPIKTIFTDGTEITCNFPDWRIGGTVMGERSIEAVGTIVVEDPMHM